MATRKTDASVPLRREPVRFEAATSSREDPEVLHTRLKASEVALSLDDEFGGDPYNSTGRFTRLSESALSDKE